MSTGGIGGIRDPQNSSINLTGSSIPSSITSSAATPDILPRESKSKAATRAALDTPTPIVRTPLTEHVVTPAKQVTDQHLGNVIVRAARAAGRFFSGIGQVIADKYNARKSAPKRQAEELVNESQAQLKDYLEYPQAKKRQFTEAKARSDDAKRAPLPGPESKEIKAEDAKDVKRAGMETKPAEVKDGGLRFKTASFSVMEVPRHLLTEKPKAKKDHRVMAKVAARSGLPQVEDQPVGCGILKAARRDADGRGQIVPTSFLKGASDADQVAQSKGLTNVYMLVIDGKSCAVIRSGVIDTPERAAEFREALRKCKEDIVAAHPERAGFPMRVVSQQLNSFEVKKEAGMIDNQHMYLARVSKELEKDGIEVMHLNTPSNRWFHETKEQGVIAGIAHKFVRHGEKDSHEQNLDGLAKYAEWLSKDFGLPKGILKATSKGVVYQRKINSALVSLANATEALSKAETTADKAKFKKDIKDAQAVLKQARAGMRDCLKYDYARIDNGIEYVRSSEYIRLNGTQKSQAAAAALGLYKQLLGAQLEIERPPMDRGQEGMIIQELNNKLGVVAAMNCKSGLDRTGLWHAVKIGMENTEKLDPTTGKPLFTKMVSDWHVLTTEMNKAVASGKSVEQYISEAPNQAEQDVRRMVAEHRNEVAKHLIATGIPITQRSTGLLGLKWNPGIQENRVPLNFLPPSVEVQDTEGNFSRVTLVVYNKTTGEPEKLTKEGRELFIKMSGLRGS